MDRIEHDMEQEHERCEQRKSFEVISKGIEGAIAESQRQFDVTVNGVNANLLTATNTFNQTRPHADVEFSEYLGDTITTTPLQPFTVLFSYRNLGNDKARRIWKLGVLYAATTDQKEAARDLLPKFEQAWKERKLRTPGKVLGPGDAPLSDPSKFGGLSVEEAGQIGNVKQIYFLFRVQYTDDTGTWISNHCDLTEGFIPQANLGVQKHCDFFNDPRIPATRQ